MKKLRILVSLTNDDNDYQIEQARAAELAAQRLDVDMQIVYADNDSITQSQQLLKAIQSRSDAQPDGIVFEPVGATALPKVAQAAVAADIAWVVLNSEADYISGLRKQYRVPIFTLSSDHEGIGRIQGRQMAALLPHGGTVLYVQGPAEHSAAKQRCTGMYQSKPPDVQVKVLRGQWTEASAYRAVSSWLRLSTSHQTRIDVVAAQDDSMAVGAKKAFQELPNGADRDRWLSLPFIGCDGLPKTGQAWVRSGLLAATIFVPPNTGLALDMLATALRSGSLPPERTFTRAQSVPDFEALGAAQAEKARILSL